MPHLEAACWAWPVPTDADRAMAGTFDEPDLELLLAWCRDMCAICGRPGLMYGERGYRLEMDHDHETGLCRGYLCHGCNMGELNWRRSCWPQYRLRNPATICGVTVKHRNWWGFGDSPGYLSFKVAGPDGGPVALDYPSIYTPSDVGEAYARASARPVL